MADMSDDERQAKLEEAKTVMEELGNLDNKLDELQATATTEAMHIVGLEKSLHDLKQFVDTSPSDDQLDHRFAEINSKFEHMATTYLRERIEEAKQFEEYGAPVVFLIDRLFPLIDAYTVPDADKDVLRNALNSNRAKIMAMIEEAPRYIVTINDLINSAHPEDKVITKENYGTKIDEVIEWLSRAHKIIVPAGK